MPGPLDSGTWNGKLTKQASQGPSLLRRLQGVTVSWLWENRMLLLVVLATAAAALSLQAAISFQGFLPPVCQPGDCTGACAGHPNCAHAAVGESQPQPIRGMASGTSTQKLQEDAAATKMLIARQALHGVSAGGAGGSVGQGASGNAIAMSVANQLVTTETGAVKTRPGEDHGSAHSRSGGGDVVATGGEFGPAWISGTPTTRGGGVQPVQKFRTFKLLPPASLTYDDVAWCPAAREPPSADLVPFHPGINVLMILGAQKAGTTWLFDAMTKHPSIHGADFGYMRGPEWSKEIHYFDRWPLEPQNLWMYGDTFPPKKVTKAQRRAEYLLGKKKVAITDEPRSRVWDAARRIDHRSAFIDASPEYLLDPAAAPRIKQVLPLARFVVILRV